MKHGPWNIEDFEALSWHDVHVHGFSLESFNSEEGCSDLLMDIDYILNWSKSEESLQFKICRASLRFKEVFGLKISLDYATPSAGMCPFSIQGIYREEIEYVTGYKSYSWKIPINWPQGIIEFKAPSFTQELVGEPVMQSMQWLSNEQRG